MYFDLKADGKSSKEELQGGKFNTQSQKLRIKIDNLVLKL